MVTGDHQHSERVWFYKLGLGGKNEVNEKGWKMETFGTMLKRFEHENVRTSCCFVLLIVCKTIFVSGFSTRHIVYITVATHGFYASRTPPVIDGIM